MNTPIMFNDPTGHKRCNNMDEGGNCEDSKEDRKLDRLFDHLDRELMRKKGGRQRNDLEPLEAMNIA